MFKRLLIIALAAVMLSALYGCGKGNEVVLHLEGNKTAGLWVGQVLRIELEANATTGYTWVLSGDLDKGVIKQSGKYKYVRKSDAIGAGGTQVYRFRAIKQGKASLVFEYKRAWEKETPPAKKYKVRVIVH